jgi:hypothetical protein
MNDIPIASYVVFMVYLMDNILFVMYVFWYKMAMNNVVSCDFVLGGYA